MLDVDRLLFSKYEIEFVFVLEVRKLLKGWSSKEV